MSFTFLFSQYYSWVPSIVYANKDMKETKTQQETNQILTGTDHTLLDCNLFMTTFMLLHLNFADYIVYCVCNLLAHVLLLLSWKARTVMSEVRLPTWLCNCKNRSRTECHKTARDIIFVVWCLMTFGASYFHFYLSIARSKIYARSSDGWWLVEKACLSPRLPGF